MIRAPSSVSAGEPDGGLFAVVIDRGRCHLYEEMTKAPGSPGPCLVREGGVEPPHPFEYTDLNRARLPIPPLALASCLQGP